MPAARKLMARVIVARREFPRSEAMASRKWAAREAEGPPADREWKEWSAAKTSEEVKEYGETERGGRGGGGADAG